VAAITRPVTAKQNGDSFLAVARKQKALQVFVLVA